MLRNTFCHLDGIGTNAEKMLWEHGILSWRDLQRQGMKYFSGSKWAKILASLRDSRHALANNDVTFFIQRLPVSEQCRIYQDFRDKLMFLDIETTGLSHQDETTTLSFHYDGCIRTLIRGRDLLLKAGELSGYDCIMVTFNGRRFDLPFMRRDLGVRLRQPHIDLREVCKARGHTGGLKAIEKALNLTVNRQVDMDGRDAIRLWRKYERLNEQTALQELIRYNQDDVRSLQQMMVTFCQQAVAECPFQLPDRTVSQ